MFWHTGLNPVCQDSPCKQPLIPPTGWNHERTNGKTKNYTPLSINAGGIINVPNQDYYESHKQFAIYRNYTMQTAKTLIRLCRCPGWSETSLGAHSLCSFCHVAAQLYFSEDCRTIMMFWKFWNSLTFPWLLSFFLNFHDWIQYFPDLEIFLIFQTFFPDRGNPDAVWSQSSMCTQWVAKYPRFLHADSKNWSDRADAQVDRIFAGHTDHFVSFALLRLISLLVSPVLRYNLLTLYRRHGNHCPSAPAQGRDLPCVPSYPLKLHEIVR